MQCNLLQKKKEKETSFNIDSCSKFELGKKQKPTSTTTPKSTQNQRKLVGSHQFEFVLPINDTYSSGVKNA